MTLVAFLLFASGLVLSTAAIVLTVQNSMPRITEVIEAEFAPAAQVERKVFFGQIKAANGLAADIIAFPPRALPQHKDFRLAA